MRLTPFVIATALVLAACGDDATETASEGPTTTSTNAVGAETTTTTAPSTSFPVPPTGRALVRVDGGSFDATACAGADGAVVATLPNGDHVQLVREEGDALRYLRADGTTAETADLDVIEAGGRARYAGTVEVDGQPVDLVLIPSTGGDPDCEA